MDKEINVRVVGEYAGHNCSSKGVIKLKFTFPYDEMSNYLKTFTMISSNVKIGAKIPPDEQFTLGEFTIDGMNTKATGETTITFASTPDFVEMDNVNNFLYMDEMSTPIVVFLNAVLEDFEEDEEKEAQADNFVNEAWNDNEDSWGDDDENNNDEW